MFLSRQPNLAENPAPADSPEAGRERQGGKIGAEKGRYVMTNPKPQLLLQQLSLGGRREPYHVDLPPHESSLGLVSGCSRIRKEARQQSIVRCAGRPRPAMASVHPGHPPSPCRKHYMAQTSLGNRGPIRALKTGFSGLPGKARVSALLPSPHIFH